jgi:geranylgeranyl pyrophosphate synthase
MNAKEARIYARELIDDALAAISIFGPSGQRLTDIARFIIERRY